MLWVTLNSAFPLGILDPNKLVYILTTYLAFILPLPNHPYPNPLISSHLVSTFSPDLMIISGCFQGLASSTSLLCPVYWFSGSNQIWRAYGLACLGSLLCVFDSVIPLVCLFRSTTQICVAVLSCLPHWAALRKGTLSLIKAFFPTLLQDWFKNPYSMDVQVLKYYL